MRPSSSADGAHRSSTASPGPAQAPGPPQLRLHRAEPPARPPARASGAGQGRGPGPAPLAACALPPPSAAAATPAGGAHARSVFSMMNLTFSSVSSVMRTVGWLAYGMAAPRLPFPPRPARLCPALPVPAAPPSAAPCRPPTPPGGPDPDPPPRWKQAETRRGAGALGFIADGGRRRRRRPRPRSGSGVGVPASAALVQPRQVGDLRDTTRAGSAPARAEDNAKSPEKRRPGYPREEPAAFLRAAKGPPCLLGSGVELGFVSVTAPSTPKQHLQPWAWKPCPYCFPRVNTLGMFLP